MLIKFYYRDGSISEKNSERDHEDVLQRVLDILKDKKDFGLDLPLYVEIDGQPFSVEDDIDSP